MLMDAASRSEEIESQPKRSYTPTLLDLVAALVDSGMNDLEVVQSVTRLLNSRRVRLIGRSGPRRAPGGAPRTDGSGASPLR